MSDPGRTARLIAAGAAPTGSLTSLLPGDLQASLRLALVSAPRHIQPARHTRRRSSRPMVRDLAGSTLPTALEGVAMSVIKPRTRGKHVVEHRTRLDRENHETLYAYAAFVEEEPDYVMNQLIETVLAKDKEFVAWRGSASAVARTTARGEDAARESDYVFRATQIASDRAGDKRLPALR